MENESLKQEIQKLKADNAMLLLQVKQARSDRDQSQVSVVTYKFLTMLTVQKWEMYPLF